MLFNSTVSLNHYPHLSSHTNANLRVM